MTQTTIKDFSVRVAAMLLMMLLTATTAWAQEAIDGLTYNTTGGYYEINDEQDLIDLANYVNGGNNASGKTFKQTQDITLTEAVAPIGISSSKVFKGTYDGGGYTISGLNVYSITEGAFTCSGLFGRVQGANLHDIVLISPTVSTDDNTRQNVYVGPIVAYTTEKSTQVSNCTVINPTVTLPDGFTGDAGAIVGRIYDGRATNCHFYGGNQSDAIGSNLGYSSVNVSRVYTLTATGCTATATATVNVGTTSYYNSGTAVSLTAADRDGYIFSDYASEDVTITDGAFTMPAADVAVAATFTPDPAHFSVNAAGTEYTIKTAAGWNVFCDLLADNTKGIFTGKTVKLGDDISVTRMAGGSYHDFCGTFDGQGHTLTFNYGKANDVSIESYVAPFRNAENCIIENLHVAGDIYTSGQFAAGIICSQYGTVTIRNCRSSINIHSSHSGDGTHGGLVANNDNKSATLTIEGCVFDGSLLGTTTHSVGGFIGWRKGAANIYNSLFIPTEVTVKKANSATFGRNDVDTHNCYYTYYLCDGEHYVPHYATDGITRRNGHAPLAVTAGDNVTISAIALSGDETHYAVSGITAYSGGGLQLGQTLYYGSGDQLSLTLSNTAAGAPQGYQYTYVASAGTLSGTTLTMPDADVTITVSTAHLASTGLPVAVAYVDADGTLHDGDNAAQAVALDGSETSLPAGTYFVGLENVNFDHTVTLGGDVHLILADNCTMNIGTSESRINGKGITREDDGDQALTIYGQNAGTGALNVYTGNGNNGIVAKAVTINGGNVTIDANGNWAAGIFAAVDDITINGGNVSVTAPGTNAWAIYANRNVTINGGTVEASGTADGIRIDNGTIAINGGTVNASGSYGINADDGTITLGWNKPTDRIYASNYSGTVSVKDGLAFVTDEATPAVIGGTISDLAAINGKTLKPAIFYLVGNMTNWSVNADYLLTVNPGNTSEMMIQNVPLNKDDQFKVVYSANGTEATTWYPGDGYNYWISADGIYDIYFRQDYQGGSDWHFNCIYAADVSHVSATFAPAGFCTYYHGMFDVTLPEGVKARIVTARGDSEGTLTYQTIADGDTDGNVVPAGTAVMLQTAPTTEPQQKTLTLAVHGADSPAAPTLNLLHGSDVEGTTTGDGKHYKLTYGNDNTPNADVFGWYWGSADGAAFTSPAHKAWLVLPADANARSFFGLPDDDTTGIVNAEANSSLFTLHSSLSEWYTIDGMKLSGKPTAKGVYILNGRKIVIK